VAAPERSAPPLWWYLLVGIAALFAVLWLVSAVVGAIYGLVKVAVLVILAIAAVSWAVNRKAGR
jgi:hypothetical protein